MQDVMRDLPTDKQDRKSTPITTGVLDYFPAAMAEVARVSNAGNDQHNPGQPLHWARGKSTDHADCIVRHLVDRGTLDDDGQRHTAKVAWRALALLQEELEAEAGFVPEVMRMEEARPPTEHYASCGAIFRTILPFRCTRLRGHRGDHSNGEVSGDGMRVTVHGS